jgi:hypothetical protein
LWFHHHWTADFLALHEVHRIAGYSNTNLPLLLAIVVYRRVSNSSTAYGDSVGRTNDLLGLNFCRWAFDFTRTCLIRIRLFLLWLIFRHLSLWRIVRRLFGVFEK